MKNNTKTASSPVKEALDDTLLNRLDAYSGTSRSALKKSSGGKAIAGYCAGAVAACAAGVTEAEAVTWIYNVNQDLAAAAGGLLAFEQLDIEGFGHASNDFQFSAFNNIAGGATSAFYNFFRISDRDGNQVFGVKTATSSFQYASKLAMSADVPGALGALVSDSTGDTYLAFRSALGVGFGPWTDGESGYIGFQIPAGGTDFNYGWIEVSTNADNASGTIIRYGIDTTVNTDAVTGVGVVVPEPSRLALLAIGAAGIISWRRRKLDDQDAPGDDA
jgi:hypothetical protein